MRYLGTFASEEDAARAFDQEAIRLRGTGIELNLPHEAKGFMKKLQEEEEASGELHVATCLLARQNLSQMRLLKIQVMPTVGQPARVGPPPVVSAGPDFEGNFPRQPNPRLSAGTPYCGTALPSCFQPCQVSVGSSSKLCKQPRAVWYQGFPVQAATRTSTWKIVKRSPCRAAPAAKSAAQPAETAAWWAA